MAAITETQKKFTYFSYDERFVLELYLKGTSHFPKIANTEELANILHKSRRSIHREILRGMESMNHPLQKQSLNITPTMRRENRRLPLKTSVF